jgi:apolipoprotein N-acyltransferase
MSFKNYGFAWAMPIGVLFTGVGYGIIFLVFAKISEFISSKSSKTLLVDLIIKAVILLLFSYFHPIEFDWFKPELIFTNSYLGIKKWQFAIVLLAVLLSIYRKNLLFLFLVTLSFPFDSYLNRTPVPKNGIVLSNSMTTVEDKWNSKLQIRHITTVLNKIDRAIANQKRLIIFPESIFAFFLNNHQNLMTTLQALSNDITIVIGALYLDDTIPRNSTYIFKGGKFQIANKAVLVPFGEQNPLPKWMGKIINKIFFDGAPDYVASSDVTDYIIDGVKYRNAICYEGTSEKLYEGEPKNMILISNNGWVAPSIEPTEQKILLQYYSKKYGTTIYHAVNMSPSYTIHNGEVYR